MPTGLNTNPGAKGTGTKQKPSKEEKKIGRSNQDDKFLADYGPKNPIKKPVIPQ